MLPALELVIWNRYKRFPQQWTRIFAQESTKRGIFQSSQVTGVGLMRGITEGAPVGYDKPLQGFNKTFIPVRFGLGIQCTVDVMEDDSKLGIEAKKSVMLANSCKETMEVMFASAINNGFDPAFPGPDGAALFSASHPLVKAGGFQNNLLPVAADLDQTSLQLALTDYETMLNAEGARMSLPLPRLVVTPANRWSAAEIIESKMRSNTANNAINPLQFANGGLPDWFVWNYLTDPDAWFLCASPEDTGLLVVFQRKPYTRYWVDDETETGVQAMRFKADYGVADFYGTYGTPGA
jgi:hypothetical protein